MVPELVSIITPCYGTAKYLPTLLQSVLSQKYPKIEMFVIDDGSPDDIKGVVDSFKNLFAEKGYDLHYVWQSNAGQSAAIQNGLERINGEYLVWPDSDDFFASETSITKMVERLQSLPDEYAMVRTQQNIVDDSLQHRVIKLQGLDGKIHEDSSFFEDCMFQKNSFYFGAGAYMVRTKVLLDSTEFPIYTEKQAGQNWQLLLPVLYKHRCSTILEPLYNILERTDSHSRVSKSPEKLQAQIMSYQNTLIGTIDRIKGMTTSERKRYHRLINNHYLRNAFHSSLLKGDNADQCFWRLFCNRGASPKLCAKYISYKTGIYNLISGRSKKV